MQTIGRLRRSTRVGLLTPYFSFFDGHFPPSFRTDQEDYAAGLARALETPASHVIASGLVDSPEAAEGAGRLFASEQVDVLVVAPLMAAPPAFVEPMLGATGLPILLWLDDRTERIASDISELDATRYSSFLGSVMLASALHAADVAYRVVATGADRSELVRTARGAGTKRMLATLRLGILGAPIAGYSDVGLDPAAASRLGITVVPLTAGILSPQYPGSGAPPHTRASDLLQRGETMADAGPALAASMALAHDLERAVDQYDLDVLIINCHSDDLRWHPDRGIVGCLAASALTTAGVPVACTGDAATGVALAVATWLGGEAQYCEGYVVGRAVGDLLLSSCGLAHADMREPSQPLEFHGNGLYPGARGEGCCVRMAFAAGPATILAVGANHPRSRPRFIWKTGVMSGRFFRSMNGPAGTFSFDPAGERSTSARWIETGPAHHVALARGDLDLELRAAGAFVDASFVDAGDARDGSRT